MKKYLVLGVLLMLAFIYGACQKKEEKISPQMAQMAKDNNPYNKGMVAAANPYAVEAGVEILRKGGSAIDAAIAVQTVLSLVEPQSSGIGGGAFLVFYDAKTGKVLAYNGREKAPSDIDENLFLAENGQPLRRLEAIVSGKSTGAPGVIAMLNMAHEDYGNLAWKDSFNPAIELAEKGFVVSPRLEKLVKLAANYALEQQKQTYDYFYHGNGTPLKAGEIRDNKPYAETLRLIAKDWRNMYEGELAEQIIKTIRSEPRPGTLSLQDLKNYKPVKSRALCNTYRDYFICGAQPPSSGGIAVQSILGQLENFDMKSLGMSIDAWHLFAEASALAYADRDKYVADPDFVNVPVQEMLDKNYLKSRAKLIKMQSAIKNVKAGQPVKFIRGSDATPDDPGTSHFVIVDKWGNVASMTTTVESLFGSQRMVGGFMLNNQLTDFSFRVKDKNGNLIANRPQANKRPRSSMAPHIVFDKNGQFYFATGSPGGSSIIAYTAKTIIGIIDWGLSPQAAIDLPNFISRNGSVRLEEAGFEPEFIKTLEARGHKIIRSKGEISGLHIIMRKNNGYVGGADKRREGIVLGE